MNDYYTPQQLHSIWDKNWFELFQRGLWMDKDSPLGPIDKNYDDYHPYVCHVCKRGPLQNVKTLKCGGCRILCYCSKKHQVHDWKNGGHKQLCKAMQQVQDLVPDTEITDLESLRKVSLQKSRALISLDLNVKIHSLENSIMSRQPRCRKCFRSGIDKSSELLVCPRCSGVALCQDCFNAESCELNSQSWELFHSLEDCDGYRLNLCCIGMVVEQGSPLLATSNTNCTTRFQPKDWVEYFHEKGHDMALPPQILRLAPIPAFLSENLSSAMTIHHLLSHPLIATSISSTSRLVIHLIGASSTEWFQVRSNVELARLNPQLESLSIVLIGPDMGITELPNDTYLGEGRLLNDYLLDEEPKMNCDARILVRPGLYHTLLEQGGTLGTTSPDLIVAFNPGINEPAHLDNWTPTIQHIATKNVPFCITGWNHKEVVDDVNRLQTLGMNIIIPPTPNPFRSLRPQIDPVLEDGFPFYYGNASFAVAQGG